jgi:hypothetical protein
VDKTRATLKFIRVFGYGNLAALVYFILTLKGPLESWLPTTISASIALVGTVIYYAFWHRLFPTTPKSEGRRIMRSYILATTIATAVVVFVTLILWIASTQSN